MSHRILTNEHGLGSECFVLNSEECELTLSSTCQVRGGLSLCEGGCRSLRAGDEQVLNIGGMLIGRGMPKFYAQ
jgi:hypothetical protein